MSKYQNGKIYLIKSNETEMVYIGSTHGTLEKRFASHKSDYKRRIKEENFRPCHSYEILKYSDAYIELIEDFPCNTKQELLNREGEITKNTPNRVNIIIQGRNMKQYRDDNKEKLQKQGKEYAIKNREKINAQARLFYSENKEIKHEKRREYEL